MLKILDKFVSKVISRSSCIGLYISIASSNPHTKIWRHVKVIFVVMTVSSAIKENMANCVYIRGLLWELDYVYKTLSHC